MKMSTDSGWGMGGDFYYLLNWYRGCSQVGAVTVWGCQKDLSFSSGSLCTLQLHRVSSCDITSWCQDHSVPNRAVKSEFMEDLPSLQIVLLGDRRHVLPLLCYFDRLLRNDAFHAHEFSPRIDLCLVLSVPLVIHSKGRLCPEAA